MREKARPETVFDAVRHIVMNEDGKCTVDGVLAITGGSKTTVARIMREHEAEIARIFEEKVSLPPEIQDECRSLSLTLWSTALKVARTQDEDYQRSCRVMVKQLENEAARSAEANAIFGDLLQSREAETAELRQSLQALEGLLAEARASEREQRERADRAEASNGAKIDLHRELRAYFLSLSRSVVGETGAVKDARTSTSRSQAAIGGAPTANATSVGSQIDWVEAIERINGFSDVMEACSEAMSSAFVSDPVPSHGTEPESVHAGLKGAEDGDPASLADCPRDGADEASEATISAFNLSEAEMSPDGIHPASATGEVMTSDIDSPNADPADSGNGAVDAEARAEYEACSAIRGDMGVGAVEPAPGGRVAGGPVEDQDHVASPALAASQNDLLGAKSVVSEVRRPIRRPEFLMKMKPAAEANAKEPAWDDPYGDRV